MSKNLLYSKKWHSTIAKNKITRYSYKRVFENNAYVVKQDDTKISDKQFIEYFNKYQHSDLKNKKFNQGNIFFKLKFDSKNKDFKKENEIIKKYTILSQSNNLASKKHISRIDIQDFLNDQLLTEDFNETIKNINIKFIQKKDEGSKFDKTLSNTVFYSIDSDEVLFKKRKLYNLFIKINKSLFKLLKVILDKTEFYYNRNYKLYLNELAANLEEDQYIEIIDSISKIKKEIQCDIKLINGFVEFYLTTKTLSSSKKIFKDKFISYLQDDIPDIEKNDIVEFLIGEINEYNIKKYVLNNKKEITSRCINTYIKYDKHERYKQEKINGGVTVDKDTRIKSIIEKVNQSDKNYGEDLNNEFSEIFKRFQIPILAQKVKTKIDEENNLIKVDTFLFPILKEHYNDIFNNFDFESMNEYKKAIYKIIYEFLKGRINKCIVNNKYIDFGISNQSLEESHKKSYKKFKQYVLEHLIYIGKLKRLGIDTNNEKNLSETNICKEFQIDHATEELNLELLVLFASSNLIFNDIFSLENIYTIYDFFGEEISDKIAIKSLNKYGKIFKKIGFINDKDEITEVCKNFFNTSYTLRSALIHNNLEVIQEIKTSKLNQDTNNLIKAITDLKPSDLTITKSLNLQVIFKEQKNIIKKINNLNFENPENEKYFPSFSKLIPTMKTKLNEYEDFKNLDEKTKPIVENAYIYINEILYKKKISDDKFVEKLLLNINSKNSLNIEQKYILAQKKASKGNKMALKNYHNSLIKSYFELLLDKDSDFNSIFEFTMYDNYELFITEVQNTIQIDKSSEYVLKSINANIKINSDYEYIISILCLLTNNTYSNKIKNRVVSTSVWLNTLGIQTNDYNNLVIILNEIIKVKKLYIENLMDINNYKNYKKLSEILKSKESILNFIKIIFETNNSQLTEIQKIVYTLFEEKNPGIVTDEIFKSAITNNKFIVQEKDKISLNDQKDGKELGQYINKIDVLLSELKKSINNYLEKYNDVDVKKYEDIINRIIEKNASESFDDIYTQGSSDKKIIYIQNIFDNISKNTFDNIWNIYGNEYDNININEYIKSDINDNIELVDNVLNKVKEKTKNETKQYKEYLSKKLETKKTFKEYLNQEYDEFINSYNIVSNYKEEINKLKFNNISKINNYLIEINWKLAIQIFRLERDLHNLIVGYFKLIHNLDITQEVNDGVSIAYIKNTKSMHYKYSNDLNDTNYEVYTNIIAYLGLDINKNLCAMKESDNIRNYIAHFYILREPFKCSIISKIKEIDYLLRYRKRYQNSTIACVLEVFKGDVSLNYNEIKKFNLENLIDEKKIEKLYDTKKVSLFNLDYYKENKSRVTKFLIEKIETENM